MSKVELLPLGELGEIVSGATPSTTEPRYWNGEIPWVTPADLTGHEGIWYRGTPKRITKAGFDDCSTRMLPPGAILFSSRAPIGHCAIAEYPVCTNQGFKSIVPGPKLDSIYAFFGLQFIKNDIIARGRGATFAEVSTEIMEEARFPWRTLGEQQPVAARLAQADRLCRTRRFALQLSDTFLKSAFVEMFGASFAGDTPKTPLGDLVTITGGGTPARDTPDYYTGNIPWLTSKDMIGEIIHDTQEHITEAAIAASATKLVPAKSILVVVKSKVLMHRLPLAISGVPLCHGQDLKSIQCSKKIEPEFARYGLQYYEPHLLNLARGANTEGLTLPMLLDLPIFLPPPSEQKKFTNLVTRFERHRIRLREAERQADHLFQRLLADAFS
jgi:type I restriction enzyme S subunit